MKKFIFSALAAIGLLLSPSCSDDNEALSGSGNEALVSFSVNLADGIQTKATIGDGTKAKNLVVDVFEKNTTNDEYTQVGGLRQKHDGAFNDGLTTTVNFNLVKGKTYRLIFWAQKQSVVSSNANSPYNIDDLSKIKVNYHAGITVDEDRDAFLYVTDPITVSGNFSEEVTMTRPFAQLNYLIDKAEYDAAVAAGMVIQKAKVTVAKVATELYPLKNSVGVPAENVMFEVTDFPTNFTESPLKNYITLPKPGVAQESTPTTEKYYYLASKYFLVYAGDGAADKAGVSATLATTSFKLVNSSDQEIADYEFKVPAVPVQRNFRTNIYGNLITSQGTFEVTIDPILNGESNKDNNLPQYAVIVNSVEEINNAINEKKATTFIASKDFQLSTTSENPTIITVPKNYASGNNGVELTFDLSKATVTSGTAEITITEGTGTQSLPENVNVIASGNITITLPTSHVTLNGAEVPGGVTYGTVTASTSGTTLVVPNGVTVTTLNVKKGNVRIEKGGKVGTIVRTVDNEDIGKKTIVFLEDGGELENMPTNSEIELQTSISTVEGLKAFAKAVNNGYNYAGQTVVLTADIDLNGVEWTPIGLNADDSKKFKGTFDGQGHTISNFKVNIGDEYKAAGFFGALNGTAKDFTIENATIVSKSTGNNASQTDNGVAVVAGSIYTFGLIQNVTVRNSSAEGHHYVAGIAGYVYGNVENCTVENSTFTSTPNVKSDTYDNGDKAGGIVGYVANNTVSGCSVSNVTITAYRDLGGIVGCAAGTVTNNTVNGLTLIIDATHNYKGDSYSANAKPVVGRQETGFSDGGGNTATNVVYQVASETALAQAMTYAQDATVQLTAGTYSNIINVKGKRLTIEPIQGANVVIAGVDGQQNGEHTGIIICNNITFDNSKQAAGWYTGTGNPIYPCVGVWGGDFTFNNCTFLVDGNTNKETGIMTWWTTEETNMRFKGCMFNGIQDHEEARAMQIYGHVNLTVENCTFMTKKRYALKYAGKDGNTAILKNNTVSNCEYMVELGSSTYPGSNYTVTFDSNTLAEGIYNYKVANEEGATINGGTSVPTE